MNEPTIAVHIGTNGETSYLVPEGCATRLLIIDERAPHDRVYEITDRVEPATIEVAIGGDPVGSKFDARHEATASRLRAAIESRPHLTIVDGSGIRGER